MLSSGMKARGRRTSQNTTSIFGMPSEYLTGRCSSELTAVVVKTAYSRSALWKTLK